VRVVAQPSAHFGEGGGLDGAGDGLVTEGGVPPWGKTGDVGVEVASVGMNEVGLEAVGSGGGATRVGSSKVKRGSGKRSI
jgi:hypothetical protein